jgi:uncharacterized damage-inducible protein DinB
MSATPPPEARAEAPFNGEERESLEGFLDYHRETLLWKVSGLTAEQLKQHPIPSTKLTLLGLVRHITEVERSWFAGLCGLDTTWIYCTEDNLDGDFDDVADADADADLATYRAEIDKLRRALPSVPLDTLRTNRRGEQMSLRWIYLHMIEEYARHNGHADLLREAIDGATGE